MARRGSENTSPSLKSRGSKREGALSIRRRSAGRNPAANTTPAYVVVRNVAAKSSPWSHHRSFRRGTAAGALTQTSLMRSGGRARGGRAGGRGLRGRLLGRAGHIAQLLARLEPDREAGRNLHFLGGAFRVAADAAVSGLHEEHAEAAQLDALAARQRLAQHVDDRLDGCRRFLAPDAGRLRDRVDDVVLDHVGRVYPSSGISRKFAPRTTCVTPGTKTETPDVRPYRSKSARDNSRIS